MTSYTNSVTITLNASPYVSVLNPEHSDQLVGTNEQFPDYKISNQLSGVVIDQSAPIISNNEIAKYSEDEYLSSEKTFAQEFKLPTDFKRRSSDSLEKIPSLTGIQLHLNSKSKDFTIQYAIQTFNSIKGWMTIAKSTETGNTIGDHWFWIKFPPLQIASNALTQKFRLVINGNENVNGFYYSRPNPFASSNLSLYDLNTNSKITKNTDETALRFRILANVADSGTDGLGNSYRSLVERYEADRVLDLNSNTYWMSKPNPSKYGVENLYFNLSTSTTLSSVYIDPITENIACNIYYSNEAPKSNTVDDWDMILWKRVPKEFKLTKAQNYFFPNPIHAQYLKIEFTQLKASSHISGDFQKPVLYKKHPQWVLEYFLSWYGFKNKTTYDPFTAGSIDVEFPILNLAYNFYKDDILQLPNNPDYVLSQNDSTGNITQTLKTLLNESQESIRNIDIDTYFKINTDLKQFFNHPASRAQVTSAVNSAALISSAPVSATDNYNTEDMPMITGNTGIVSTFDRNHLIQDKTLPPMYFFVECRHEYREAMAKLSDGKAYFAGVKEIAFQRNDHSIRSDDAIYMTTSGDDLNFINNDFVFNDAGWSAK